MKQAQIDAQLEIYDEEIEDAKDERRMYQMSHSERTNWHSDWAEYHDATVAKLTADIETLKRKRDDLECSIPDEEYEIPKVEPKVAPNKIALVATTAIRAICLFGFGVFFAALFIFNDRDVLMVQTTEFWTRFVGLK
jgi:hypothetical protein